MLRRTASRATAASASRSSWAIASAPARARSSSASSSVHDPRPQRGDVAGVEHAQQGGRPELVGTEAVVLGARDEWDGQREVGEVDGFADHAPDAVGVGVAEVGQARTGPAAALR